MCDYSLHGLPNRLAIEGEQLVTHRFSTLSIGLAAPSDLRMAADLLHQAGGSRYSRPGMPSLRNNVVVPAVCIPPGTHLRMYPSPNHSLQCPDLRPIEDVTFVQVTATPFRYRDGIEFGSGLRILLQMLPEGVRFDVLSMDGDRAGLKSMVSEVERILADFERELSFVRSHGR